MNPGTEKLMKLAEEVEKMSPIREKAMKKKEMMGELYHMPYKRPKRENPSPIGWLEFCCRMRNPVSISITPKVVFLKNLTKTDLEGHHNRLLLNKVHVKKYILPLLTQAERCQVEETKEGLRDMVFIDQRGVQWPLTFKLWRSSGSYMLIGKWKDLVKANGVRALEHWVRLSAIGRDCDQKLCMVVGFREGEDDDDQAAVIEEDGV